MWVKIKFHFLTLNTAHVILYQQWLFAIHTGCVVPGAGAFEVAVHNSLMSPTFLKDVKGRARLGVQVLIYPNSLIYFYSSWLYICSFLYCNFQHYILQYVDTVHYSAKLWWKTWWTAHQSPIFYPTYFCEISTSYQIKSLLVHVWPQIPSILKTFFHPRLARPPMAKLPS